MRYKHFNYKCSCGEEFRKLMPLDEYKTSPCPSCNEMVSAQVEVLANKATSYIKFHEGWYEHFGPDPIYISSKRQLREVSEKTGKISHYLEDSC